IASGASNAHAGELTVQPIAAQSTEIAVVAPTAIVKNTIRARLGNTASVDDVAGPDEVLKGHLLGGDAIDLLVEVLRLAAVQAEALHVAAPRRRVVLGVRDGDGELERLRIDAPVALLDAHALGVRIPELVEPAARVEAHGVDDELVALETADGEPVPFRIERLAGRQRTTVEPDLAPIVAVLEQLHDAPRRLDDLERRVRRDDLGD